MRLNRARSITWLKHTAVVFAGIVLGLFISQLARPGIAAAIALKLDGNASGCPWSRTISITADGARFTELASASAKALRRVSYDQRLDVEQIASPERSFWIRRTGRDMSGQQLLGYLLAEHRWMIERTEAKSVRAGDIVLDCGAHIGVFTHTALKRGAAKVVAFEPEPVNRECLLRNFAAEIGSGRVVVIEKGVWSGDTRLELNLGVQNSGAASVVGNEGGGAVRVDVTTIDRIVSELRLPRVDFIKMDIEGAEREALAGAMQTLKKHRPRLMLDSYHRPDDMAVLPSIIRRAHPDYAMLCGPCEMQRGALVPHVTFYE